MTMIDEMRNFPQRQTCGVTADLEATPRLPRSRSEHPGSPSDPTSETRPSRPGPDTATGSNLSAEAIPL